MIKKRNRIGIVVDNYTEERPWGTFTILDEQEYCKVKRIEVVPGGQLSLQSHSKRAETWTMVSGVGTIIVNETKADYTSGDTVLIAVGDKHRFENNGTETAVFIEVQTGSYFGEDDIVRYDDVYGRVEK